MNVGSHHDGGLDPSLDLALVTGHPDPDTFETYNVWLVDGARRLGVNMHLYYLRDGIARERASLFLPDGRTYITHSKGTYDRAEYPGGSSLRYHCVKPFERWNFSWKSTASELTETAERAGFVAGGPEVRVEVAIEAETITEPWIIPLSTGPFSLQGPAMISKGVMLGKYEQILHGLGSVSVAGETFDFAGVGLRGHVRGPRDTTGMGSHAWLTGHFSSGRGFGLKILYTLSGEAYFSEAYIANGGKIIRATIQAAPTLSRDPNDRSYVVELDALSETIRIEGTNFHTTWIPLGGWGSDKGGTRKAGGGTGAFASGHGLVKDAEKIMSQSCARFLWDGEEGFGMCELSG
ncbi:hypothetical protein D3Y57_04590 (plasmid) [Sphingomonas paeninsulae]|uniref:Uncharacterized protein n=1 Tax=Sphingomonas paeninsulae TaxID=2319844 RepID=A0A494THL1_SPHPE|nr:hypothetical protein [Sphingomonas paeninsulae]AYJ85301.1 hypothetical protein D3Y57_04590 [Sphingomonas paeninsulae]